MTTSSRCESKSRTERRRHATTDSELITLPVQSTPTSKLEQTNGPSGPERWIIHEASAAVLWRYYIIRVQRPQETHTLFSNCRALFSPGSGQTINHARWLFITTQLHVPCLFNWSRCALRSFPTALSLPRPANSYCTTKVIVEGRTTTNTAPKKESLYYIVIVSWDWQEYASW